MIAIIGHGPASLAAAWAARGMGYEVDLFGPGVKSVLRGPVLLQRPVPGMTVTHPDGFIRQHVVGGTIIEYRQKLYGDINININGDILEDGYHAWKMDETYNKLWEEFASRMVKTAVGPESIRQLVSQYSLVVNTAPANLFCTGEHDFSSAHVGLTWETAYDPRQEMNSIYFNADPKVDWVRSSNVFGNIVTEWPTDRMPPHAHVIQKPISTNCNCNPEVLRTGRFGAWKNEVWVDTAYYDTRKALLK